MFSRFCAQLLFLALLTPVYADGPPLDPRLDKGLAYVFDLDALPTVTLTITPGQWNLLLANYDVNPRNEEKVSAAFAFEKNGKHEQLQQIGVRIRGNLSRKRPEGKKGEFHDAAKPQWHHAHFKLDFNKFKKEQHFHELKGMNLKFFNNDPTHVREVFCYSTFRDFGVWTTPFSSYAKLVVQVVGDPKPAYFGIYQMVENVDKHYLKVRYGKDGAKGDLWKCLYQKNGPADLVNDIAADSSKIGKEDIRMDEKLSIRPSYDLKTNKKKEAEAKTRFLKLLEDLNRLEGAAFEAWFAQTFDADQFLRFLATNTLVGMWDDYWVNANNYYLYLHPGGKVFFVPYDYDNSLGTSLIVYNSGTQGLFNWGPMDNSRPLVYKVLKNPKYKAQYARHLRNLLEEKHGLLAPANAMAKVRHFQALIARSVTDDTVEGSKIEDKPADWAKKPFYRLLSGNDIGMGPDANYFETRARFAEQQLTEHGF